MNMDIDLQNIPVESIALRTNLNIDILRLDAIHPEISGNKYFKLIFTVFVH
jgi:1-aminocyclopropane-1-carboxylate deaminase/D-cysteine desulfhydrase-like pyridoxal-dependent ACC family enzyme